MTNKLITYVQQMIIIANILYIYRRHGVGLQTWHDGSTFEGHFERDMFQGHGVSNIVSIYLYL